MPAAPKQTRRKDRVDWNELDGAPKPARKNRGEPKGERNGLSIYSRLKPRNEERHAYALERDFGPQADCCRRLPCAACGKAPTKEQPSDPHHEPPRSLGGTDKDTVPLCRACHELRGASTPEAFWSAVGLDPEDVKDGVRAYMTSPLAQMNGGAL